ncbi:MAG: acetamidase/formamidase family protein [Chloroflexota bacterium]|nr:acetamidase/formamidase family protein [Chloroflexota bacterium]
MAHHEFSPTTYYNTMGTHPPALHIEPGDSIATTAVDARGFDHENVERAGRPNPQTGPFYVNGAEAGDTLVLQLHEVVPNRRMGWTTGRLAPNVLDFGYEASFADEVELAYWDVDVDAGTVTLTEPQNRLTGQPLPLRPMLGTVGVAPGIGEAISTMTSAAHGGNMDYNGITPGVTVYLPVFADGALFFLGDGHALQGDGEMDGTGVEISMDVRFSLDLIKDKTIGWPRAEDDTYLMACGNHRPLDQAVQHATTEMVSWLETDYGLTTREAHMLLGRFVEYDVGNMFDPAYTMVCKVKKSVLAELGFARTDG